MAPLAGWPRCASTSPFSGVPPPDETDPPELFSLTVRPSAEVAHGALVAGSHGIVQWGATPSVYWRMVGTKGLDELLDELHAPSALAG